MEFKCSECNAAFYYKRYLTDHTTRVHGAKKRKKQISCSFCEETFSSETAHKKHVSRLHTRKEVTASVQCQEDNCISKFRTVCDFREHLVEIHKMEGIDDKQEYDFENYSGTYINKTVNFIYLFT